MATAKGVTKNANGTVTYSGAGGSITLNSKGQTVSSSGASVSKPAGKITTSVPKVSTTKTTTSSGSSSGSSKAKTVSGGSNPNNLTTAQVKEIQKANGLVQDGIIGPKTQVVLNKPSTTQPQTPTPVVTPSTPVSSANLKIGSKGNEVANLQNFLISKGYDVGSTGADSIYGANTDAAVKAYQKANNLTADGIVGVNTAAKMNNVLPPAPLKTDIKTDVPDITDTPVRPPVEDYIKSYIESQNEQIANMQITIDNQRNEQLQRIQEDKQQTQQELNDYRNSQQEAIQKEGDIATREMEMKLSETQKEITRMDEAYKQKQVFVDQLMQLTTQGNALIASQKATTGLSAIRNPRVNETIANIAAQAGTIQMGISAQENNMTQTQNQLSIVTTAITNTFKEQLDYYKTLEDYYDSRSVETGNKLIKLTDAEQDFINTTIDTLQKKIDRVQTNADTFKQLFINPETAVEFAKAGITILTPQSEWGTKLKYASDQQEIIDFNKDMILKGYTPVGVNTGQAGLTSVNVGGKTLYFKAPVDKKNIPATPEEILQSVREDIDQFIYEKELSVDVAYTRLRNLYTQKEVSDETLKDLLGIKTEVITPEVLSTQVKTPITAYSAGQSVAKNAPDIASTLFSGTGGIVGPKEVVDIASGIGNFFKGLGGF